MIMTPYDSNFRRRKPRVGRGAKAPKNLEGRYDRALRSAVDTAFAQRVRELVGQYESGRSMADIRRFANCMRIGAAGMLEQIANRAVPDWFSAVEQYAANKFTASLRDALGIDATSILDQSVYDAIRTRTIGENVELIKGLSEKAFIGTINKAGESKRDGVLDAILDDFEGLGFPDGSKSLADRIRNVMGIARERASVIARDQTAKLNSQMAQARQEDAGVTHYIWRTAGDRRVVGNPGGLYPTGNPKHGNHFERNGMLFAWSDPPEDGHPGEAILCRCVALPRIVPAKLKTRSTGERKVFDMAVA